MTTSSYLSKKYYIYSTNKRDKPFTPEHVAEELLCSTAVASLTIKKVLGKAISSLNYTQFEKVVCYALDT